MTQEMTSKISTEAARDITSRHSCEVKPHL